jgi:ribose/xylose/arabinose/galactoside ABC-type transport system permease subunit
MIIGRLIGWIVLLAGLSVLTRDLLVWLDTGRWLPLSLAEAWRLFGEGRIEGIAAVPLAAWAVPVLTVLGAALIVLCRRRGQRGVRYRPS